MKSLIYLNSPPQGKTRYFSLHNLQTILQIRMPRSFKVKTRRRRMKLPATRDLLPSFWKHLAEIAFHIHPEDACEMDKELVIGLCKEYEALAEDSNEQHLIEMDATKPQRKHLLQKLVTMFGDGYFKMGTLDALQLISTHGVPAFQYRST